jgi:hypothetical protein
MDDRKAMYTTGGLLVGEGPTETSGVRLDVVPSTKSVENLILVVVLIVLHDAAEGFLERFSSGRN